MNESEDQKPSLMRVMLSSPTTLETSFTLQKQAPIRTSCSSGWADSSSVFKKALDLPPSVTVISKRTGIYGGFAFLANFLAMLISTEVEV